MVLTLSLLSSCGQKYSPSEIDGLLAGNIVGGLNMSAAAQKEAGVVGLVIVTDQGTGLCSGSLISKRIVLTAAHCIDPSEGTIKQMYAVFTTDVSKANKDNVRGAVTGVQNEAFAPSNDNSGRSWNDVALILLSADAPADFKLARLPTAATLKAGAKVTQMGYGRSEASRNATADTSGTLRIVDGIALIKKSADGKELMLNEATKGSCNGDSGGPAFVKDTDGKLTQVGLDSRGNSQTSCIGVGIYTNVASHLDWIKSHSASLLANASPAAPAAPVAQNPAPPATAPHGASTPATPGSI